MIVLAHPEDRVSVKLDGSVSVNQMECYATWRDNREQPVVVLNVFIPDRNIVSTNDMIDVNLIVAPQNCGCDLKRTVDFISIFNTNSSAHKVTITFNTNGNQVTLWKGELSAGERMQYTDLNGFISYDKNGAIKYTNK